MCILHLVYVVLHNLLKLSSDLAEKFCKENYAGSFVISAGAI